MEDLIIYDLVGNTEMLVGASVTRKISDTAEKYITVTILENKEEPEVFDLNTEAFDMMKNQCFLKYKSEEYVIKKINYKTLGKHKKATITAYCKFYEDFNDNRRYDTITGTFRINSFCEFIFKDSGYKYEIDYTNINGSVEVENFGDDSLLSLLNLMADKFDVEYKVEEKKVFIAKTHSRYLDVQMRYEFNINDPNLDLDSTDLRTYIRGYGKQDEETGKHLAYREYTSPLAQVYGTKHADPVRDERFTDNNSLLEEMKSRLVDYIPMTLTLSAVDLEEMDIKDVQKGDYVWCVLEPFELDIQLRVVEIEDYSDENASPNFTFGSLKKGATQIINDWKAAKKALNKLVKDGNINEATLPASVKNSTQAISTVSSAVAFTPQGIATSAPKPSTFSIFNVNESPHDVLFGNGEIQTAGIPAVTWRGLNLEATYGDLPEIIIEQIISNLPLVTEESDGQMSSIDKKKIDQIQTTEGESYDLSFLVQRIAELEKKVQVLEEGGTANA